MKIGLPDIRFVKELPDIEKTVSGFDENSVIKLDKNNGFYIVFETTPKRVFILVAMEYIESFEEFYLDLSARLRDKGYEFVAKDNKNVKQVYRADISFISSLYSNSEIGKEIDNSIAKEHFGELVQEAVKQNASDIHIAVYPSSAQIKFKIDGRPREFSADRRFNRANIVKMLRAAYNTGSEKGSRTQDDFSFEFPLSSKINVELPELKRSVEVRFQSIPIVPKSIKVTLRLAGHTLSGNMSLKDSYEDTQYEQFKLIARGLQGATFLTGITGSGKTTTGHLLINEVVKQNPDAIINSVEDPVEIINENMYQTQLVVNEGEDTSDAYVRVLSALLRSDVDFIFQGEVRSPAQAEINAQAILTGHGLFSTLHTIGAIPSLMRLNKLGIDYFTLGSISFLNAIIYQRLYSKVCPSCGLPLTEEHDGEMIHSLKRIYPKINVDSVRKINSKGCDDCSKQGFKGRVLCSEIFMPDDHGRSLIQQGKINEVQHYWLHEQDFSFLKGKYKGRSFLDHVIHKIDQGAICPYEGEKQWKSFALVTERVTYAEK